MVMPLRKWWGSGIFSEKEDWGLAERKVNLNIRDNMITPVGDKPRFSFFNRVRTFLNNHNHKIQNVETLPQSQVQSQPAIQPSPIYADIMTGFPGTKEWRGSIGIPDWWSEVQEITVYTPGGIGDFIWIYSKLVNANKKLNIISQKEQYTRLKPFAELLLQVKSFKYEEMLAVGSSNFWHFWKNDLAENPCHLQANVHLEAGRRLELYLPALPTSFHFHVETPQESIKSLNIKLGSLRNSKNLIGIYVSNHWNKDLAKFIYIWNSEEWTEFIQLYYKLHSKSQFVIIGGKQIDLSFSYELAGRLSERKIPFKNLCGTTAGECVALLKKLKYFIAFPSGLPILSTVLNKPVFMFYLPFHDKLMYSWVPPEMIQIGTYKSCIFCKPQDAIKVMEAGWTPWT